MIVYDYLLYELSSIHLDVGYCVVEWGRICVRGFEDIES